ncbi:EAL domain-containing protein [Bacillus timonensis]|nr:EAL domain-containing protein [Bacillus timonensis]
MLGRIDFFNRRNKRNENYNNTNEKEVEGNQLIISETEDDSVSLLDNTFKSFFKKYIEKYVSILGDLHVGIWVIDVTNHYRVLYCSPGIQKISGYARSQIESGKVKWADIIFSEDIHQYQKIQPLLFNRESINHQYRIVNANNEIVWIQDHTVPTFDDSGNVIRLSGIITDITEQKLAEEKIHFYAYYDFLTGLANRRLFEKEINKRLATYSFEQHFSVLYIDINRFKHIIETFGNKVGDMLIEKVAGILHRYKKQDGIVARIGGDQFAILLPMIHHIEYPVEVAKEIIAAMETPIVVEGYQINCTISIGISNYPTDGSEPDELLRNAEVALYRAKEQGKNHFQIFSSSMNVHTYKLFQLEKDLRQAIVRDEFILHYQPKVETKTEKMVGAEALIRWNHPDWGMVSPIDFISVAEEIGMINDIGDWVLRTVVQSIAEWKKQGLPVVPISINVSGQRFLKNDFSMIVKGVLDDTKVHPSLLELEITETSLMSNEMMITSTIESLKLLGIKISLDDFGTGFSSISYLRQFRSIHTIKFDRSFIQHVCENDYDASIVKSLIHLAHGLNMNVVAEGVETQGQLAFLRENKCDLIQGYYFSKPLPSDEFKKLLKKDMKLPLNQLKSTSHGENRRKFFRLELPKPVSSTMTVAKIKNQSVEMGKTNILIENMSAGGIRFLSNIRLPVREDILLKFYAEIMGQNLNVKGHIVWKLEQESGLYQYGVELDISEDEKEELVKTILKLELEINKE